MACTPYGPSQHETFDPKPLAPDGIRGEFKPIGLVEHGVGVVTVRWYPDETDIQVDEPAWDTHIDNFQRLKTRLLPPMDQPVSALLDDLADRGTLDETLVV